MAGLLSLSGHKAAPFEWSTTTVVKGGVKKPYPDRQVSSGAYKSQCRYALPIPKPTQKGLIAWRGAEFKRPRGVTNIAQRRPGDSDREDSREAGYLTRNRPAAKRKGKRTMACNHPLTMYKSKQKLPNGKSIIKPTIGKRSANDYEEIKVPCGKCMACRVRKKQEWTVRAINEAQRFGHRNCFITLTYDDAFLPDKGSLDPKDFQLFMKRLRANFQGFHGMRTESGKIVHPIRYLACGEYGDENGRPHFHAILFNVTFDDVQPHESGGYSSPTLDRLWSRAIDKADQEYYELLGVEVFEDNGKHYAKLGMTTVGDFTHERAQYVAGYVTKKITGDEAKDHYERLDPESGLYYMLHPEFAMMSNKPGLGKKWCMDNVSDCFPKGYITIRGKKYPIPRYYETVYEGIDPEALEALKQERKEEAQKPNIEKTYYRQCARERVAKAKAKQAKRSL